MRKQIFRRSRVYLSMGVVAALAALIILPVSGRIDVPVMVEPAGYDRVFPPSAAKLVEIDVKVGEQVSKGQVLFRFQSILLDQSVKLNHIKIGLVDARLARVAVDAKDKTQFLPLQQERVSLLAELEGLRQEQKQLIVRAPMAGRVKDLNRQLHVGRWVKVNDRLLTIIKGNNYVAKGYILERDLWRVKEGDKGQFVPDDYLIAKTPVKIKEISLASSPRLELQPLASVFGGKIASRKYDNGEVVPIGAAYQVTLALSGQPGDISKVSRGIARIDGIPESIAAQVWRQVLRVLVRESGA